MKRTSPGDVAAGMFFVLALIGLPLIGIMLAGEPIGKYTEFPPMTRYVEHAGFSWLVFFIFTAWTLAWMVPFSIRYFKSRKLIEVPLRQKSSFPWWGWLGVLFGVVTWVLAWTRFSWFEQFQHYTFSPQWFAYIIVVNALTFKRTGSCMMTGRTGYFLLLFPLSSTFWWFFEYLNRFVQNWYYVGAVGMNATPLEYFVLATLPFSTVLPAVLGTCELLETLPRAGAGLDRFFKIEIKHPRTVAWITLFAFCAGLAGIGTWPDYLFPLLWVSPVMILISLQAIRGKETIFSPVKTGNWQRIILLSTAALVCGFFWEMWNFYSQAKWIYAVPFVNRFHIFEMPLIGYAGYLPFGVECAVIGDMLFSIVRKQGH